MNRKALMLTAAAVAMSMIASGCVALLAAGAAGVGGYAWANGKLSFTTSNTTNECHDATLSALRELGIRVTGDAVDRLEGKITGKTATGDDVTIDLEPLSAYTTKIDIRVGFFGNKTQSTMIADAIKKRL